MKRRLFFGLIVLIAIHLGFAAVAVARLGSSQSTAEEPGETAGANLVLAFPQRISLKDTVVEIRDSSAALVEIGVLRTGKDGMELEIPLSSPLGPDVYKIRWRAVSTYGALYIGEHAFKVEPSPSKGYQPWLSSRRSV